MANGVLNDAATGVAVDARTRVEEMTRDSDFSWVADLLVQQRDTLLERWIEVTAAQPFHFERRERAVADHIPALVDALIALLRRTASPALDPGAALNEPAVLTAAQSHARIRTEQGLTASDVVAEFRLLRQEIGWALRSHVNDDAPASDVLGAEMLLHDALDDAAFLAVLAIDERESELQRLREALAAEELRLASMLEQLPAAVIMAEAPSGQVGHPEVRRLTRRPGVPVPAGENPNEWQGFHRDGRRYSPEDWPLARAVRTGEVVTDEEIDYVRDDGKRGTVSVNAAPVRDRAGVVVAGVAIFTDVTERKTLEQEKQAFLNAITHDLRSPLTTMMGVASLLRREVSRRPIPQQRMIERLMLIDDAGRRMAGQLTELQDIARLRQGKALELERRAVDLIALVQGAAARHQATGHKHTISVVQTGLDATALLGEWDESRLDRVLDNLIGNAVKFSPDGGTITLSLAREAANAESATPSLAVLRVSDEGMGIPRDDVSHVFDWFRRASNVAGKVAGTGIGLAAARQILELHGGTIDVESEEGVGSTFTLHLPLPEPHRS
ncbi:MAG TPA: ATP-binding protein [Chloroflexota bacterium]|nr:ATP-binding protein [Chloroflexota bacterium]